MHSVGTGKNQGKGKREGKNRDYIGTGEGRGDRQDDSELGGFKDKLRSGS